ncbi:GTPase ObgE [Candidatus Saccharibacteria bacterium]|nr:GTPase ObgE [Candidatus Saccharibacteria bacterium]
MFVDVAKVELHAGKGGDGAVSFRHEIYIPKGGPDGGDGGRGGSIIFRADKDTNTLLDFRYNPILRAEDGKNGSGQRSAGRSGKDLIVEVPIGTMVRRDGEVIADLVEDQEEAVIARGGEGGFGNAHFKSSTRQTPRIAEVGEPGEEFIAELELKLLADVGLVGLPNAGKSTFLSVVSNAKPEIADYPFTTITPNLGVATIDGKDLLIADIPGLIEGASEGKGLGHAFLRHIDRTAVLLHLIDVYNDDAGVAYKTIRTELEKYSDLRDRPEIVALTKCEGLDQEIINLQIGNILRENPDAKVFAISSAAHQGIDEVLRELCNFKYDTLRAGDPRRAVRVMRAGSPGAELGEGAPSDDSWGSTQQDPNTPATNQLASVPTIRLSDKALKDTWTIEKEGDKFIVKGEKIEKFARKTDLNNYASLNRLRDVMKKMGIRAELTTIGAGPDSIIKIADKEFTLVEDY